MRHREHEIVAATAKSDVSSLARFWAPEFVWIGPIGQILTKAQRLAAMRSGQETSAGYMIDDEDVRIYGAVAVVTFRSTVAATVDGRDISSRRRVTNVLVKRSAQWQAVSQHSTLIQEE